LDAKKPRRIRCRFDLILIAEVFNIYPGKHYTFMKNLRFLTLLFAFFATAAATADAQSKNRIPGPPPEADEKISDWKTFTFEKYKFKARFPEKPGEPVNEMTRPGEDATVSFEYLTGSLHLIVKIAESDSDYAARGITLQKVLQSRRDNMLNAVKNGTPKIIKEYDFEQNGFPAKFLHVRLGSARPVRCKLIQVGKTSYLAVAITDNEKAAAAFLDSFEILE
jgi:hypothetical protein